MSVERTVPRKLFPNIICRGKSIVAVQSVSRYSPCRDTVRVSVLSVSRYSPCRGTVRVAVEVLSVSRYSPCRGTVRVTLCKQVLRRRNVLFKNKKFHCLYFCFPVLKTTDNFTISFLS